MSDYKYPTRKLELSRKDDEIKTSWKAGYDAGVSSAQGRERCLGELSLFVNKQAEDEGLWFIAETASEGYLQQGLRKLHGLIEHLANEKPKSKSPR